VHVHRVYIDEPFLLMRWDDEHKCVFVQWRSVATSAQFRDVLTKVLAVARDNHACRFVSDTRNLELITDQDQRWMLNTWAPLAIEAGLQKVAVVIAQHWLGRMGIERIFNGQPDASDQLRSRKFDSVTGALLWVAEPHNSV
jgi:hypothetical protein